MPTYTIKPNEKYDAVFGTDYNNISSEVREMLAKEHEGEVDDYLQFPSDAVQELPCEDESGVLTWELVSPPNDPDILTKMAEYFHDIDPTDDMEVIRAKLRLGDVEWMANTQVHVQNNL